MHFRIFQHKPFKTLKVKYIATSKSLVHTRLYALCNCENEKFPKPHFRAKSPKKQCSQVLYENTNRGVLLIGTTQLRDVRIILAASRASFRISDDAAARRVYTRPYGNVNGIHYVLNWKAIASREHFSSRLDFLRVRLCAPTWLCSPISVSSSSSSSGGKHSRDEATTNAAKREGEEKREREREREL